MSELVRGLTFIFQTGIFALGLFAAMLAFLEIGRRIGVRGAALDEEARTGVGVVEGAIFALLGLLIAFTFSGAATRFDERRSLIIDEVNAIGTAYLRVDLVPAPEQEGIRDLLRRYLDARIATYDAMPDIEAAEREYARSGEIQKEIWARATAATTGTQPAAMLLLPALNETFDIATTRYLATRIHPPPAIFGLLAALALASALLAGHAMSAGGHHWLHVLVFAFALSGAVFVILNLEYPRLGLIHLEAFDDALSAARAAMGPTSPR